MKANPFIVKSHETIIAEIDSFSPIRYGKTRNYKTGSVSYLSPYISRGVISLHTIAKRILERYSAKDAYPFVKELAWRDYFQKVWEAKGDEIFSDLKQMQSDVKHTSSISSIIHAQTGIVEIDASIRHFYETGYLHNHIRMYLAALVCNFGKAHWYNPSKWMYYHLLDGDPASNALSWQWVAGSFSSKKYYFNQDNINKYTGSNQKNSFLDKTYEELIDMEIQKSLTEREEPVLLTNLPKSDCNVEQKVEGKVFVYNSFNLDPEWHKNEAGERILLLEPSHFEKHPISEHVMQFIIDQSKCIPNIKVCACEFSALKKEWPNANFIYKKHPTAKNYSGTEEIPLSLFPEINGYFPSFSSYWKKAERELYKMGKQTSLFD